MLNYTSNSILTAIPKLGGSKDTEMPGQCSPNLRATRSKTRVINEIVGSVLASPLYLNTRVKGRGEGSKQDPFPEVDSCYGGFLSKVHFDER